ncbi:MAG: hypothetical protein Tsb0010_08740 [Parvularculaceae bacterium]
MTGSDGIQLAEEARAIRTTHAPEVARFLDRAGAECKGNRRIFSAANSAARQTDSAAPAFD